MNRKQLTTNLALVLLVPLFSSCATVNDAAIAKVDRDNVLNTVQPDKTTKADIKKMFGDAKEIEFKEGGYEVWIYKDQDTSAAAMNHVLQYVPLLPLIHGNAEIISEKTKKELVILFDSTGVVKKSRVMLQ